MATKNNQIYVCQVCGNAVEVVRESGGTLSCCNQPMELQEEKTAEFAIEKHVPVVTKVDGGVKVRVGSTDHPMTAEHLIEWIQVFVDGGSYRKWLSPGGEPEVFFPVSGDDIVAREFCNLHGLWRN